MSTVALENTLRELPKIGKLVKDRGYRQVWRFEHDGKAYFLKFYPNDFLRARLRRLARGSPAMREFVRLQMMQKARIPSPRAVAVMMGFTIENRKGDAVILEAIEPSVQVDFYLNDFVARGEAVPNRQELAKKIIEIVYQMGRAKLGHEDLHLGNFLLSGEKLYLLDGYAVRIGGMKMSDIAMLGHSVQRFATRTDLLRGWEVLGPGGPMPRRTAGSRASMRDWMKRIFGNNRYFGQIDFNPWRGVFYKHFKHSTRWSHVSAMHVSEEDWKREWPKLWEQIQNDQLAVIKRTRSGDVLSGRVTLVGKEIDVVIKRPKRRYWYRYLTEIGRGARPRRAWRKSWEMIIRHIPTAWPRLVMEKRVLGYVTDTLIVFERVPGPTLADVPLDAIPTGQREMLLRRTGHILRKIEQFGFSHFDAKSSNWIVTDDEKLGPTPVLIDIDGIRKRQWIALGIDRLLRSMQSHPQYTREDSLALCQGYAPFAPFNSETNQVVEK